MKVFGSKELKGLFDDLQPGPGFSFPTDPLIAVLYQDTIRTLKERDDVADLKEYQELSFDATKGIPRNPAVAYFVMNGRLVEMAYGSPNCYSGISVFSPLEANETTTIDIVLDEAAQYDSATLWETTKERGLIEKLPKEVIERAEFEDKQRGLRFVYVYRCNSGAVWTFDGNFLWGPHEETRMNTEPATMRLDITNQYYPPDKPPYSMSPIIFAEARNPIIKRDLRTVGISSWGGSSYERHDNSVITDHYYAGASNEGGLLSAFEKLVKNLDMKVHYDNRAQARTPSAV